MAGRLDGKIALVTGGSRGIGRAIVSGLSDEGAIVCFNYKSSKKEAEDYAKEIGSKYGRDVVEWQVDVAQKSDVEEMVSKIVERYGRIDILVNNAGINYLAGLNDITEDQLREMFDVNVRGVLNCVQACSKSMIQNRYGKIVNISSIAGIGTAFQGTTAYASTKAAVITLTKRFAFELGKFGINVNSIAPGFIMTDMNTKGKSPTEVEAQIRTMSQKSMLNSVGYPEDIARVVVFLASEESRFITGQTIVVDGGRMDFFSHSM